MLKSRSAFLVFAILALAGLYLLIEHSTHVLVLHEDTWLVRR